MVKASAEKSGLPPTAATSGVMNDETSGHHGAERRPDHHGDGQVDDVAPQHEVTEILEHGRIMLATPDGRRRRRSTASSRSPRARATSTSGTRSSRRSGSTASCSRRSSIRPTTASSPTRSGRTKRRARRAGVRLGADLPRLPDPGARGRRPAHDRRGGAERQARVRPDRRPGLGRGGGPRRHARRSCARRSSTSSRSTSSRRARTSTVEGWEDADVALEVIAEGRRRWAEERS